jgi:hypothetical protein
MVFYYTPPDRVEKHLQNIGQEGHIGGYRNGWLELKEVWFDKDNYEGKIIQIYSSGKIIGSLFVW